MVSQAHKQIAVDSALETKFHGLARTVSDRHPILRLLWLLGFLALVGLLLKMFIDAALRLNTKPVATSVDPNKASFIFPDIHFCSHPMVSASYPSVMSTEARSYSETQMLNIIKLLNRVNQSTLYTAAMAFVGTVPYSSLSQNFGMRKEQTIIKATVVPINVELRLGTDITDLRHYKYLNCFTIRPQQESTIQMLGNVLAYIDIVLYTDASYNQTVRLMENQMDVRGLSFFYYEALLGSGFRIFFTPRGAYPDDYTPSVTVGPGFTHDIKLSMKVIKHEKDKGECAAEMPNVQFLDQATLQPVSYQYTLSACYATKLFGLFARVFKSYLPWIFPVPYAYKDLPSTYNFSSFNDNTSDAEIIDKVEILKALFSGNTTAQTIELMNAMQDSCKNGVPCHEVVYKPSLSSIRSPLKQNMKNELSDLLRSARRIYQTPGRDWLLSLLDKATQADSSTGQADNDLRQAVSENLMRVQIRSAELTSTEVVQTMSYKFFDLTVEVGGLFSLFVGGSMLTLLEVVELCVCLIWGRKLEPKKVEDQQIWHVQPRNT